MVMVRFVGAPMAQAVASALGGESPAEVTAIRFIGSALIGHKILGKRERGGAGGLGRGNGAATLLH